MSDQYDSRIDTYEHIHKVQGLLLRCAKHLLTRSRHHDRSKLIEPELSVFNEYTPKLHDSTYGSDEYKTFLADMGEGLQHHYAHNRHHPEHFRQGMCEMDLLDLLEMLCDWIAATERHADGDIHASITKNRSRFGYGPEIERLLRNTVPLLTSSLPERVSGEDESYKKARGVLPRKPGEPRAEERVRKARGGE